LTTPVTPGADQAVPLGLLLARRATVRAELLLAHTVPSECVTRHRPIGRPAALAVAKPAVRWWHDADWIIGDPTAGWARPRVPVDKPRALSRSQVDHLFRLDAPLREKTL
jgi:hypothetical protein